MKKGLIVAVIVIAVIAVGTYLALQDSKPVETNDLAKVPSSEQLLNNMQKAGLPPLTAEGTVLHIHQHLDLTINGQNINVPAEIGVGTAFISPLHTHAADGIIHVESPEKKDFKLGQFFDEWGVEINDSRIANYQSDAEHKLVVAVNGTTITNVRDYVLKEHDEIHIWYGPINEEPQLIKSYTFAPNL